MWDIIRKEHSKSLWYSTSMGLFIVTRSYNFSEKAISLKIKNPVRYPQ